MPILRAAAVMIAATLALPVIARADDGPPGLADPPPALPTAAPAATDDGDPCHGNKPRWLHRRPRLAIGISRGRLELDGEREGTQKSLLGRVVLRRGFEVELELARTELAGDDVRTVGGAVLRTFGHGRLAPYAIAGGGGGIVERADGTDPRVRYAELGGGIMLKKRRFALGVDVRAGVRRVDDAGPRSAARIAAPGVTTPDVEDRERYVRGRVIALVYF